MLHYRAQKDIGIRVIIKFVIKIYTICSFYKWFGMPGLPLPWWMGREAIVVVLWVY